jgi:hypothetical protein
MPRTCFVIMPFSSTVSCTSEEWTEIFEYVFKPAVEGSGRDYMCKRSEATRGNVVAAIMRDLHDSYVVIADLTDRNANVFYELGVRHALGDRTILIAQKREDIPFDLQGYGSHVYSWKTQKGRDELVARIRELLVEIDANPERSDNPVSDFLLRDRNVKDQPASPENSLKAIQEGRNVENRSLIPDEKEKEVFNRISDAFGGTYQPISPENSLNPAPKQGLHMFAEAEAKTKGVSLSQVSREYHIPLTSLSEWVRKGLIPVLYRDNNAVYLPKDTVQETARIYHEAKESGQSIASLLREKQGSLFSQRSPNIRT